MKTTKIYDNDSQCRAAGGRKSGADEQEKTQRIASGSAQDDNVFDREQDLKGAKSFKDSCDEILEFIGDSVLVAHNASFDVNFLNDALVRVGKKPLDNPVIDTLDLSYSIHADRKAHRLGNVARIYNIKYDEEVAHRADYDAKILSDVYLNMLNELKHVKTLNDLSELCKIIVEQCDVSEAKGSIKELPKVLLKKYEK